MTGDGLNTLTYDGENRAVTSAGGGTMSTYTYDGNSLRVKKQVGSGTAMVYIFSGTKVIAEYGAGANPNSPAKEYIYTGGQLLATIAGSTTTYHHADHLSARVNTDTNGNVAGQQGHYPYGESWYATNTTTKWQFTTYERDGGINESGNDYAMMRYHVNRLGRFSSPDRIAGSINNPQLLNRFAYVRNDPLNLIDPFGLQGCAADTCIDVKGSPDYFDTTNWVSGSGWDSSWWWGGGGGLSDPPGIPLIYRPGGGPGGGGVPDIRGPIPGGNAYDLSTLIPAPVPPVSPCQITGSFDPNLHPANDIRTPDGYGTPIYAPASGQIVGSRSTGWTVPQPFNLSQPPPLGSTNFVRFRTDSGYSVTYAHVSPIVGPQLATILGNSLIGRTDNSGRQTAPHVHVSVVDPRGVTIPPNWYFTDCE